MGILPGINATALVRATVVIAFWATALSASCAGAQDAAWTGPKLEKARALLDSVIAPRYEHPGRTPEAISVAVALGGTRVYADGRGRARPDVMAGPETVYRIGSITKQFLAVALLDAIEAHRLVADSGALVDLDSKVSSILQEGAAWDEAGFPPLTLRSLLTMTSDIVNFT